MSMRGESYREEPTRNRTGNERPARADARPVGVSAHERKTRRDEDARRFVEAMVRAGGSHEDVGAHVRKRLEQVRGRIDTASAFDQHLQDEYEFLVAQQEALASRPRLEVVPARQPAAPERPEQAIPAPAAPPSFADRVRSGWASLKERLFPAAKPPEKKTGVTAYEQTWTPARKAQRETDRAQEMASVQERAVETLQARLAQEQTRLKNVTEILTRRRREPMPANARAKYVAEVQTLQTDIKDTQRLLRIAEASRDRQKRIREAA